MASFSSVVVARKRAAELMLNTPDILDRYLAVGGLESDLQRIMDAGSEAESLFHLRGTAAATGGAATAEVLQQFAQLQRDYSAIMAVVVAARSDLIDENADIAVIKELDKIIVNESAVVFRAEEETAADGTKKTKKSASRSKGQEALRIEIEKDAASLLGLKAAHAALAKRKLTTTRLKTLRIDAQSLSGKLADRAAKKGEEKAAGKAVSDAVVKQRTAWAACYRLLRIVGQQDERVRQLLKEAKK